MKYTQKWMVVPYIPHHHHQHPEQIIHLEKDEIKNQLHSVLAGENVHPEEKLRMYNQILNKNYSPPHPVIPENKVNENEKTYIDIQQIKKKTRKPRGHFTPISNSITKNTNIKTRNAHKKDKILQQTPIKSLSKNEITNGNLNESIQQSVDNKEENINESSFEPSKPNQQKLVWDIYKQ